MIATRMAPSRSASCTLPIEAWMKSAWRNSNCGAPMPGGRLWLRLLRAACTSPERRTVSALGCFCTLTITAGWPFMPASPRLVAAANFTSANCLSRIGWPSRTVTARLRRSSRRVVRPRLRIRYSRALSSRKPPLVLLEKALSALSSCSKPTPSWAISRVSGSTRNCRTSPPMGITWATPGIDSRRGRRTKSAYSRICMGSLPAPIGRAISMISPITEEIGPMFGLTPSGSCSRTSARRSPTSWRLR